MVDSATPTDTPASSWHDGLDADMVSTVTNRGLDKMPADQAARELVKSYRNLERMQRTPADQLLRLPKQDDPVDLENFWRRLGKPEKAEDYAFEDVEFQNDAEKTQRFKEVARKTAQELHMPKDMAEKMVAAIFGWGEKESEEAEVTARAGQKAEEVELFQAWGSPNSPTYRANAFLVDKALADLNIDQDTADAMRNVIGLKRFMEVFHKIGQSLGEDKFVGGDGGVSGVARGPLSAQDSKSSLAELKKDPSWRQRFLKGDKQALLQFQNLTRAQMSP